MKSISTWCQLAILMVIVLPCVLSVPHIQHPSMKKEGIDVLLENTNIRAESHMVETEDGYLLEMFRLIHPEYEGKSGRKAVLLMHGFLDSGDCWVVSGTEESLGIYLANRGYDVWLGNNRGTKYSLGHVNKNITMREYWDFSLQELGKYDVPALVRYIKNEIYGGLQNVYYVGVSQGSTQIFAGLSDPQSSAELQKDLVKVITLAPVIFIRNHKTWLLYLSWRDPSAAGKYQREGSFPMGVPQFENDTNVPLAQRWAGYINSFLVFKPLFMTEAKPEVNDMDTIKIYQKHFPSGSSTKAWVHWQQLALSNEPFKMFDYGKEENQRRYGQDDAPFYDFGLIKTELHIVFGATDNLTPKEDIESLEGELKKKGVQHKIHQYEDCGHLTFSCGKNESQRIFKDIRNIFENQLLQFPQLRQLNR